MASSEREPLKAILIVEDEPVLLLMAIDMVEEAGFEAVIATDADVAFSILVARSDIRLVFTDIDMPGSIDGLKLAAAVRDRWPPIEIIVTSGKIVPAETELPERSRFFSKPYDQDHVVRAMRRMAA